MLKDTDKYDNSAHFTYSEYKKKVKKAPNKDMTVFISVFIIGVLIILGFAKILSPNVDVGITDENGIATESDEDSGSSIIDDRLKSLQMEDSDKKDDDSMFSPELDEKVVLPRQHRKTEGQMQAENADLMNQQLTQNVNNQTKNVQTQQQHSAPQPSVSSYPSPSAEMVNAKVVVGYYATEKQAEVAKTIIQDSGLNVSPVVKNLGNYYTLQVGSYSTREKAQQAANNLLKSNFPARVIIE